MKYEIELSDEDAATLVRWGGTTASRIGADVARQIDEQRPIGVGDIVKWAKPAAVTTCRMKVFGIDNGWLAVKRIDDPLANYPIRWWVETHEVLRVPS